jgi:hypothetical protein
MDRGLDWYKRDPIEFLDGVQGMGPELIGAYAVIVDLLYARAGATPRDDRHLSGVMGCSMRKATALTDKLIEAGKITVHDGFITNSRASRQSKSRRQLSETRAEAGRKGGEKSGEVRKNNSLTKANGSSKSQPDKRRGEEIRKSPADSSIHPDPEQLELTPDEPSVPDVYAQAFDFFQVMARRANLPVPAKLSDSRKAKLKARLKDCGGLEGWQIACAKVEASEFCTGKTGWVADLDFMLQESSFNKIMEGSYDNRTHNNNGRASIGGGMASSADPEEIADRAARITSRQQEERAARGDAGNGQR